MAPNKKNISTIVETFSDLDLGMGAVKPQYIRDHQQGGVKDDDTLTRESASVSLTSTKSSSQGDDYWTWSSNTEEEEIRTILSAANIEAGLIQTAEEYEREHYWDEAINDDSAGVKSTQESYWDWSANPNGHVLTADHIQTLLHRQMQSHVPSSSGREVRSEAAHDEYWDMTSAKDREEKYGSNKAACEYWDWPGTKTASKELVTRHFETETSKDAVSCVRVEQVLVEAAQQNYWTFLTDDDEETKIVEAAESVAANIPEGYWDWNPPRNVESEKDEAKSGSVPSSHEYWTWHSQ